MRKKTRTRVQVKDIKLRSFKNLFLRFKSKYLCCSLQNKIIKKPISRTKKFQVVGICKICMIWLDGSQDKVSDGLFYLPYRKGYSLISYLKTFWIDFLRKESVKHNRHLSNFSPTFWAKSTVFSDTFQCQH